MTDENASVEDSADGAESVSNDSSTEVATTASVAVAETGAKVKKPRKKHKPRRIIAWVLVVLAALMIPLSIVTYWAVNTVTNTNHYVETLAPLGRNHVVTDHLATRATNELFEQVNVQQKLTQALPSKAAFIAAPLTTQAENFVEQQLQKILRSEQFVKLWDNANRRSHGTAVAVLTGHTPKGVKRANQVIVNVTPILKKAITQLDQHNFTVFNSILPQVEKLNSLSVTLVSSKQLAKAQTGFHILVQLKWFVPLIALVLAGLATLIAVERRKTMLRITIGASIMTMVILAGLTAGRSIFIHGGTVHGANAQVSAILYDTVLRFLKEGLRWLLLILVLLSVLLWVVGHSRSAMWVKHEIATGYRWLAAQFRRNDEAGAGSSGAFSRWVVQHVNGLRIVGIAIAALIVLLGGNLTGAGILAILIVLAIYLGVLQVLVVAARRASEADGAETDSALATTGTAALAADSTTSEASSD
jgi:hypothetical protein